MSISGALNFMLPMLFLYHSELVSFVALSLVILIQKGNISKNDNDKKHTIFSILSIRFSMYTFIHYNEFERLGIFFIESH